MEYFVYIGTLIAIYATLTISLNLLVGYTGLISIAQAGIYGVGAYTTALLALHLTNDLLAGQVAYQLLCAGVAERAGERAADLAGQAERAAPFLGNVDGLDLDRSAGAARRKAEQPFAGTVIRHLLFDDLRPRC